MQKAQSQKAVESLFQQRSTWEATWRDLGDHFSPYSYQLDVSETNQGDRKDQNIVDEQGIMSVRAAVSGLMSGATSPARRWFSLTPQDPQLADSIAVQRWCEDATERLDSIFQRTNLYKTLPVFYEDDLVFGTAAMTMLEVPGEELFDFQHQQMGTYALACDSRGRVNQYARKFKMTASQMVEAFGLNQCSMQVQNNARSETKSQEMMDVWHYVSPNWRWNAKQLHSSAKPFRSCYFEPGKTHDAYLAEQGFDEFPVIVGRWKVRGQDVYGRSPALDVLGSCRALQQYNLKTQYAIEKELDPPMNVPAGMHMTQISLLPGAQNQVPDGMGNQQLTPTHAVKFNIADAVLMLDRHSDRIRRGLFEDLFLMIANSDGDMTAREIIERQEEKIQQLGPVLLNLSHETQDPLVSRALAIAFRRGAMPPVPPELEGQTLKIVYVSTLAEAQDLVEAQAIAETVAFAGQVAAFDPNARHAINATEAIRKFGQKRRSDPDVVRDDEEVAALIGAEQQAMAEQRQAEQTELASKTAKNLSQSPTEGKNALTDTARAMEEQGAFE